MPANPSSAVWKITFDGVMISALLGSRILFEMAAAIARMKGVFPSPQPADFLGGYVLHGDDF